MSSQAEQAQQQQIMDMEQQHMGEIEQLQQQHVSEIEQLQQQHVSEIEQLQQQHMGEIEQLEQQHLGDTEQLEQQHASKTKQLEQQHTTRTKQLEQQHATRTKQLEKKHVAVLNKQVSRMRAEMERVRKEKERIQQMYDKCVRQQQSKRKQFQKLCSVSRERYDTCQSLRAKHEKELAQLRQQHTEDVQRRASEHAKLVKENRRLTSELEKTSEQAEQQFMEFAQNLASAGDLTSPKTTHHIHIRTSMRERRELKKLWQRELQRNVHPLVEQIQTQKVLIDTQNAALIKCEKDQKRSHLLRKLTLAKVFEERVLRIALDIVGCMGADRRGSFSDAYAQLVGRAPRCANEDDPASWDLVKMPSSKLLNDLPDTWTSVPNGMLVLVSDVLREESLSEREKVSRLGMWITGAKPE